MKHSDLQGADLRDAGLRQAELTEPATVAPCLLTLDEATPNVNPDTEPCLRAALDRLVSGRTSFVIAHRLSTVRHASHIL